MTNSITLSINSIPHALREFIIETGRDHGRIEVDAGAHKTWKHNLSGRVKEAIHTSIPGISYDDIQKITWYDNAKSVRFYGWWD
jgi:hypothetical protein